MTHGTAPIVSRVASTRHDRAIAGIDGIVIRGRVRASITIGRPNLRIDDPTPGAFAVERRATTLTLERIDRTDGARVPSIVVRIPRLRGVATSGDVDLTVDDRSDRPLFLDLAGAGRAHVRGAVPLVRTTTSGSVDVDFTESRATVARVHARERSRVRFAGYAHLTIVAVDDAMIEYEGPEPDRVTRRNGAIVRRIGASNRVVVRGVASVRSDEGLDRRLFPIGTHVDRRRHA